MLKVSKKTATILIILLCVASVYGAKAAIVFLRENMTSASAGRIKGDSDAPIKIVEFIDFQCSACAKGAAYLKEKMEDYPGVIRVEVKYYPLQMHKHGFLSSQYAECASRQGEFWPYQDLLLARQSNWSRLMSAKPAFDKMAEEVSLDRAELDACLGDESVDEIINENKEEGRAKGVKSTPSYFINGEMIVGKKSLDAKINELLEEYGY